MPEPTIKAKIKLEVDEGELAGAIARSINAGASGTGGKSGGGGTGVGAIAAGVAGGNVAVAALGELVSRSSALNDMIGTLLDMLDMLLTPVLVIFQLFLMPVLVWVMTQMKPLIEKQVDTLIAVHDGIVGIFGGEKIGDKTLGETARDNVANAPVREEDVWAAENTKRAEESQQAILTTWDTMEMGAEENKGILLTVWEEVSARSAESRKKIEEDYKENQKNWDKFSSFVGEDIPKWIQLDWEEKVQPFLTETVPGWIGSIGEKFDWLLGEKGVLRDWISGIGDLIQGIIDKIMAFLGMKQENDTKVENPTSINPYPTSGGLPQWGSPEPMGAQPWGSATININQPVDQDKLVDDMTNWLMFKGLVVNI